MFDKPPKLSPKIETPIPTTGVTFDAERFNKETIIMPRSKDAKANAAWMTEAYRKLRSGEILTIQLGRGTQIVLINGKDKIIRASEEVRASFEEREKSFEVIPPPKTGPELFLEKVREIKKSGGGAFSLGQHNFDLKNNLEYGNETIPTKENILSIFKELTKGVDFKNIKKPLADKQGIYQWDIVVTNPDNTTIEYSYTRPRDNTTNGSGEIKINILFLFESGVPRAGYDAASYVEGNWILRLEEPA